MAYPKSKIEKAIQDEIRSIRKEAIMRGSHNSKAAWEPEIDSLNALRISLRIEDETGLIISEEIIPPGGFNDVKSCITAFLNETEREWIKSNEKEVVL